MSEWTPEEAEQAEVQRLVRASQRAAAEPAVPDLLNAADPDWCKFQDDDPDWFLRAAGRAVRKYIGWHLAPNIQETRRKIQIGSRGIIMLPSRHVTAVDKVLLEVGDDDRGTGECGDEQWMDPDSYVWYEDGWIQRKGWAYYAGWYYSGYYYGNDPYYLPVWNQGFATVSFWHGYRVVPDDVKEVVFELASQSMMASSGNVKEIQALAYRLQPSQPFGLTLNPDQKNRLANYRIGMTA